MKIYNRPAPRIRSHRRTKPGSSYYKRKFGKEIKMTKLPKMLKTKNMLEADKDTRQIKKALKHKSKKFKV